MASERDMNLALFLDFDNVAIGARDARQRFDIHVVLERLLEKGKIVVKKAYADWSYYQDYMSDLHGAAIEMIEVPSSRISGKNSADIRMVVDAMDLCYSKDHIDAFVVISGDSDFSPLVSKLRENAKTVIGIGVKKSTSDLLIANCDEFIYYDDLVREQPKRQAHPRKSEGKAAAPAKKEKDETSGAPGGGKKQEAFDLVLETIDDMIDERGPEETLWGSMVKQAIKRRKPGFSESYYGYRSFNHLLEELEDKGLIDLERDEKSGGYTIRSFAPDDVD